MRFQQDSDNTQLPFLRKQGHIGVLKTITQIQRKKQMFKTQLQNLSDQKVEVKDLQYINSEVRRYKVYDSPQAKQCLEEEMIARGTLQDSIEQQSSDNLGKKLIKIELNNRNGSLSINQPAQNRFNLSILKQIGSTKIRNIRIKSQMDFQSGKSINKTKEVINSINYSVPKVYYSTEVQQFINYAQQLKGKGKLSNKRLEKMTQYLSIFNPFFKKVDRVVAVSFLRIGQIIIKEEGEQFIDINKKYSHFYVILLGRVRIRGPDSMRKICEIGQTVLEQIIQQQNEDLEREGQDHGKNMAIKNLKEIA